MPDLKIALYARVSTLEQAEAGQSLETQIQNCVAYAKMREWSGPYCLYLDYGLSGGSIEKRPAMTALMADIDRGAIQVLVVTKLDRAWRNVRDASASLERIRKARASLVLLDLQIDTGTSAGEMMFHLLGSFAQFERKRIGERVQEVNKKISGSGRWLGPTPPHGYSYNRETKLLEVNEEEAQIVRLTFDRYANGGMGAGAIARKLNQEGHRKRGGSYWTGNEILRLLRNPIYQGDVLYGRGIVKNPRWYAAEEDDPKWVRSLGTHAPLVSRETFERVAQKLKRNAGPGRSPSAKHLYAGLIYCEQCGEPCYVKSSSRGRWFYLCKRVAYGLKNECPNSKSILINKAEYLITEAVIENLRRAKEAGWKIAPKKGKSQPSNETMRSLLEARLERFREMRLEGEISKERFDRERESIRLQLDDLVQPAAPVLLSEDVLGMDASRYLKDPAVSVEDKRSFVIKCVRYVLLGRESLTVHFQALDYRAWEAEKTVSLKLKRGGWRE